MAFFMEVVAALAFLIDSVHRMKHLIFRVKLLVLISVLIIPLSSCAEAHQPEPLAIKEAFVKAFNDKSTEGFYQLFDGAMKKRTTIHKLNKSFQQLRSQGGSVKNMVLDKASGGTFTYRCQLQKMFTLKVVFDLDKSAQLSKMLITNYTYENGPVLERNTSNYVLPFHGEWYVFWGGKTASENYHNAYPSMRGAFDFWVMGSNGKSSPGKPKRNEDFYAFGKEIIAPVDAKVIYTINNVEDNEWPAMNRAAGGGNIVLLETDQKEYILLAHLIKGSVVVKEGQLVKQGQLLGLCGNSGNSTEPHLHFQTQNMSDLMAAKGAWTYFHKIKVQGKVKEDYSPRRGDKISN